MSNVYKQLNHEKQMEVFLLPSQNDYDEAEISACLV